MTKKLTNEYVVRLDFINGDSMFGKVQVPEELSIVSYLNQSTPFFVLKTSLGRSLLINKQHVIKIEPQETRSK